MQGWLVHKVVPEVRARLVGELPPLAQALETEIDALWTRAQARTGGMLFNGGVLRAKVVRERILEVLNQWLARPMTPLVSDDLMHAVARGAAYYGLARQGKGVRVRGGVPRSYYIGIETAMPAVPGLKPPVKALTVVPFGMEEGGGHEIKNRQFSLRIGERAQFRLFQSTERKQDAAGEMIEEIGPDMEELTPVEVSLSGTPGDTVPVTLESLVTETGMLELWFVARDSRRWKLEFNVRPTSGSSRRRQPAVGL